MFVVVVAMRGIESGDGFGRASAEFAPAPGRCCAGRATRRVPCPKHCACACSSTRDTQRRPLIWAYGCAKVALAVEDFKLFVADKKNLDVLS